MVSTNSNVIEIEVDSETNGCLQFAPMERQVRGAFDLNRVREPQARMLIDKWPKPIPGQRIRFDIATGEASLIEPLRFDEHQVTREKLVKMGHGIAPERETFLNSDPATWLYWMKRAVDAGYARVTAGQFPSTLPGKPKKNFFFAEPENTQQTLAEAIGGLKQVVEAQTKLLAALVERLAPAGK